MWCWSTIRRTEEHSAGLNKACFVLNTKHFFCVSEQNRESGGIEARGDTVNGSRRPLESRFEFSASIETSGTVSNPIA